LVSHPFPILQGDKDSATTTVLSWMLSAAKLLFLPFALVLFCLIKGTLCDDRDDLAWLASDKSVSLLQTGDKFSSLSHSAPKAGMPSTAAGSHGPEPRDAHAVSVVACLGFITTACLMIAFRSKSPPESVDGKGKTLLDESASRCSGHGDRESSGPSSLRICLIPSLNFAYGFTVATQGLLVVPLEAERLWPENSSNGLGILIVLAGLAQLIGPEAGHFSDTYRSPWGRRRPLIIIHVALVVTLNLCLWVLSRLMMRHMYAFTFLMQQVAWNVIQSTQAGFIPDLVPKQDHAFAGGASAAHVLLGSVMAFLSIQVVSAWDFHLLYATLACLSLGCCMIACTAANEDSSLERHGAKDSEPWSFGRISSHYTFDWRKHHGFFLLLLTKAVYCASMTVKGFLLFFCRDTFKLPDPGQTQILVCKLSLFAEVSAAITAVCAMLFLGTRGEMTDDSYSAVSSDSQKSARNDPHSRSLWALILGSLWMGIYWYGPLLVGLKVSQGYAGNRPAAEPTWFPVMAAGTATWGLGQGVYLAGDQALSFILLPDRNEASRYLGFSSLCAFGGATVGGAVCGTLLSVVGAGSRSGYKYPGYAAIFMIASFMSFTISVLGGWLWRSDNLQSKPSNFTLISNHAEQPTAQPSAEQLEQVRVRRRGLLSEGA